MAAAAFQSLQGAHPVVTLKAFSTQPTAEEAAKKAEEWGEKYSDECFAFEKEWEAI